MWKFFVLARRASLGDNGKMKNRLTLGVALMLLASFVFVSFAAKKDNGKESGVGQSVDH
jgi:Spy/CpxP family protein refolding chaperone